MLIHLKEDNISVNDAIEDLNDRFSNEGDKLSATEKTALNVITVLLLVLHSISLGLFRKKYCYSGADHHS